jgi:hypothetical protein
MAQLSIEYTFFTGWINVKLFSFAFLEITSFSLSFALTHQASMTVVTHFFFQAFISL